MRKETVSGILASQRILDLKKEVFRKSIHMCTAFIPFLLSKYNYVIIWLLLFCMVLYCIFELLRLDGKRVPVVSEITAAAARKRDENKFVLGPVTLVLGIITTAIIWQQVPAAVGIYALGFGDGLASLVGKLVGKKRIPHTAGKTVAGSAACFLAVVVATYCVLHSLVFALIIGFCAMLIELLPLKDFDNLLIPIIIGGLTQLLLA